MSVEEIEEAWADLMRLNRHSDQTTELLKAMIQADAIKDAGAQIAEAIRYTAH